MITNIAIEKLYPHPDNPRQDMGDLSELAESIGVNGILQNLTVVPWFSGITGEPGDDGSTEDMYRVVIGHRRLAAAKMAGLTEVPCAISDMDRKAQIGTMLLENIQRNDLTLWEQASGIQMMMDLGGTVEGIAKETGFSESTVRRRVKLLELEPEAFKQSVERGATLMDFAELDRVKDPKRKNELLKDIGTHNFNYRVQSAVNEERWEEKRIEILEMLEGFAEKLGERPGSEYQYILWINKNNCVAFEMPEDAGERMYFYREDNYGGIELYAERVEAAEAESEEKTPEQLAYKERCTKREQLREIAARAFELRKAFAREYAGLKKHTGEIMEFAARCLAEGADFEEGLFGELSGLTIEKDDEWNLVYDEIGKEAHGNPQRILFLMAYCGVDGDYQDCFDYNNRYEKNRDLDMLYAFLEELGYGVADEERAMLEGSHELYEAAEDDDADE